MRKRSKTLCENVIRTMNKIKIGLRNLKCQDKIELALRIQTGLEETKALQGASALIEELEKSRILLEKAIEISAFGDQRGIASRNLFEKRIDDVIRKAAAFVNHESNGEESLIVAAGFELKKRNNKPSDLSKPKELRIERTENSGQLKLNWKPVKNSRNYIVQFGLKIPAKDTTWDTHFSTRSTCILDALKPGKIYRIRILAVGAKGVSQPSEVIEIMAA